MDEITGLYLTAKAISSASADKDERALIERNARHQEIESLRNDVFARVETV